MLAVPSTSKRSASPDASASCDSKKPKLDTISNTGSNLSTAQLQTELVNLRTVRPFHPSASGSSRSPLTSPFVKQLHSALSSLEETKHERDNSEKWNREMQNTLQRRIDELSEKLRMNREDKERVERELSGERAVRFLGSVGNEVWGLTMMNARVGTSTCEIEDQRTRTNHRIQRGEERVVKRANRGACQVVAASPSRGLGFTRG